MTLAQRMTFGRRMITLGRMVEEFHHGDCVGADEMACDIVAALYRDEVTVVCHPPELDDYRAYTDYDKAWDEKPYLERNRDIVDECDLLVAAPQSMEVRKGGTWYTINYASEEGKPIQIIHPSGELERAGDWSRYDPIYEPEASRARFSQVLNVAADPDGESALR